MKNLTAIFMVLIGLIVNAQTYTFDYRLKIGSKRKTSSGYDFQPYTLIINSKNPEYDMGIHSNSYGAIGDKGKHIAYHFNYSQNKITERFDFKSYLEFTPKDELEIDHINVEKIDENKYSIKCFKKPNARRSVLDLIVSLKPSEDDLIRFYALDLSYNINTKIISSLKEKLQGNYVIEEYTANYKNGNRSHYFIEKLDKINLTLNIPNN
ncbi:hypothetical protein QFZ37_000010 [Chryseobacterium ginsenosidimutans]|uniref:hypothetical protein n=1 Tax=Chryseobacterium ginsenosidimutans TaxID=687846 RepID=UPI002788C9A0|nr:hypothetical protein [Chryseobacterium ginsenosidimutans]MDQ0591641.1 hypothetical protein [Chryseobacterium ginsenosidimutans]